MPTILDRVDVVTVGMGWTGGIVAAELAKAGYQVVGLEKGGDSATIDFANKHDELRYVHRQELMNNIARDTVTFRNTPDETATPVRDKAEIIIGNGVGGGGLHWAGASHRFFPYDFEIHSQTIERYGEDKLPENHSLQDWGITYEEMEPYYDKFEKTMGTSGEISEYEPPRENEFPTRPHNKTTVLSMIQEAGENLGYHPYMRPSATLSEQYENPDGEVINACQYNAFCAEFACEYGARATPITTVIPTAQKTGNFELRTHSLVTRVLYEDGEATGVLYRDLKSGEEFEQPADIVALTSFTFNNVRLLLLSDIGEQYNPETGEGIIGKNFTDHHSDFTATGFFENQKFNNFMGSGSLGIAIGDFNADQFDHEDFDFIHGGQLVFSSTGNAPISNNSVPSNTPTWGEVFKQQSLHYYNRSFSLAAMIPTLAYTDNYLDLDPTYVDEYGDPLLRVTYDFGPNERNLSEFMMELLVEVLEEMGADIIQENPNPENFTPNFHSQHDGGGVIMGDSPDDSAVNNYSQMWEIDNLFVCGASSFPHFGTGNPTNTAGALTYRATEGMIEFLENGGGQLIAAKGSTSRTFI